MISQETLWFVPKSQVVRVEKRPPIAEDWFANVGKKWLREDDYYSSIALDRNTDHFYAKNSIKKMDKSI